MSTFNYSYKCNFKTNLGDIITITVPNANDSLTGAQVKAAMQAIINSGAVSTDDGVPTGIDSAEKIVAEASTYTLTPYVEPTFE